MSDEVKPSVIRSKTKAVLADRKNANNIADIITYMESTKPKILFLCISSLQEIFEKFLITKEMNIDTSSKSEKDKETYKLWLLEKYKKFCLNLVDLLEHEDVSLVNMSLLTLSSLFKLEREYFTFDAPCQTAWPNVIQKLLVHPCDIQSMLSPVSLFEEHSSRYICLTSILSAIQAKTHQTSDTFLNNVFCCLDMVSTEISKVLGSEQEQLSESTKKERKLLSKCWLEFLKYQLPMNLYKRVLVTIPDKVIPCLTNPLNLSDFLTHSYNRGGVISLLALSGIFILIDKHNLNYPEFYPKLYSLLNPSVFHTKYRARFFYNLDLFLSSTHLPAYMTAAFIKKLARISLRAPPHGLVCSVPLIYNLINRHRHCRILIDRAEQIQQQFPTDPYDPNVKDISKCNAIESSLWELKTLQRHYSPAVARKCQKVDHLKNSQIPIGELLETSPDDMFSRELEYGEKINDTPINLFRPPGILNSQDNKLGFWCME